MQRQSIPLQLFAFFALCAQLSACVGRDCAARGDEAKRDWCYYERSAGAAESGQLDAAVADIRAIQAPLVRAYAIDKLVAASPKGLSLALTEELCGTLPAPHQDSCLRSWARPHLWN